MTINNIQPNTNIHKFDLALSKTNPQRKRLVSTRDGFLINNFVKDTINNNIIDTDENFIIPPVTKINTKFEKKTITNKILENPIFPLAAGAISILAGMAIAAKVLQNSTKTSLKPLKFNTLPELPRNMNLNSEEAFVTYNAIQNPNIQTILGAITAISFAGMVFVCKNFIDGLKEIWVKKNEAKIQRNLQEKLIEVETRSFSGKNMIIRNLMREKADEMNKLANTKIIEASPEIPKVFKKFINFKGNTSGKKSKDYTNTIIALSGIGTIAICLLLAKKTFSSLKGIGKGLSDYNSKIHKSVDEILKNSTPEALTNNKENLIKMFSKLNFKVPYVKDILTKAGLSSKEINDFTNELEKKYSKVFVDAPSALGGRLGIQYYSYIDDVQGHLYNWIMNINNSEACQFTKNLFLGLATVSGLGYLGKNIVEGTKEIGVKKINAKTELDLQKELVDVELRNFEAKKRSYVNPLMDEFKKAINKQNNEKLKSMGTEILYEIKNGAPFVYS